LKFSHNHQLKTVYFRPNEVNEWIQYAVEASGGKYEYSAKGSKVSFTNKQFIEFLEFLRDAMENDEFVDEQDKKKIQSTINHVMSQLPNA
jgi:hypothetical protein